MRLLPKTIRGELALLVAVLAFPLVALIGYGLYDRTRDDLAASEATARRLSESNADRVSEYVAGLRATLEAIARRPLVRAMDAKRCDPRLADLVDLYPRAGSLIVVDREGVILCSSRPLPRDRVVRIADEELLSAMLADPRFRVSRPIVSRVSATGNWIVSAVHPVFGEDGALVGTVAMATDLVRWHSISPPKGLPAGAIVTVVTSDGTIVARSVDAEKWINRKLWDERLLMQVLKATGGVVRAKGLDGVDRIFGVSAVAGLPWFVLAGLPEEIVFASARERLMETGALLVLIVGIVMALAWGFVAGLSKPITAIAAAVRARAEGNEEATVPIAGPVEVANVARELNRMIEIRAKKEREHSESEQRFAGIVGLAADGVISMDAEQRIILFNTAAEKMFGYRSEDVAGEPIDRLIPTRFRANHRQDVERFGAAGESTRAMGARRPISGVRANGEEFPIEASISQLVIGGRKIYSVVLRDITQRETASRLLRESEARYRFLFDNMLEGFAYCRMVFENGKPQDFVYLRVNSAFEQITGLKNVVGKNVTEAIPGIRESNPELFEIYGNVARTGKPASFETYVDGLGIWFSISAYRPEEGHFVAVFNNISERKNAEEGIRQLNVELEQRVVERTSQLEASNKELESFSYSVSHDLRSPLRAIDGFSRIVQEDYAGKLDAEGRRLLGVIRDNSRKMAQLIDDLLEYSRLGRKPLSTGAIDMNRLVEEVLGELQVHGEKPPKMVLGALPPARGDATLVKLVWTNLLANAIKFSGKREHPVIEVGGHENGAECVYCVKDNGAGFDMKYRDKLFGVFQRLHSEEEFEGTGVGLAIVQRVVFRHGGRVWAEGKVDGGAAFYFSLPKKGGA